MLNSVRVLMIDDSVGDVFLIHEILLNSLDAYFEVESHATLGEALKHLSEAKFDIVLLDLTLPDSRGIDTFHKLSEAYPLLPVIVMSGVDDHDAVQAIIQSGAQDYLVKGEISPKLLKRSILNALQRKRFEEELKVFRKAVESIQVSVVITDDKGTVLYSNPATGRILGFSSSELKGKNLAELTPDVKRLLQEETFNTSILRSDGSSVKVRIHADPIPLSSCPPKFVFTIHELK